MTDYEYLRLLTENRVGWIEYDRPTLNAFNWQMFDELHRSVQRFLTDAGVRVIVLASALVRFFSARAKIAEFEGIGEDGMRDWVEMVHSLAQTLRHSDNRCWPRSTAPPSAAAWK